MARDCEREHNAYRIAFYVALSMRDHGQSDYSESDLPKMKAQMPVGNDAYTFRG
jgi:hypothetical protein